jgi:preprotein translocase subunit SecY
MKRYLTIIFLVLSVIIIVIGLQINVHWNGIVSWGLAFICLIFATYFTKYIPDKEENKNRE